MTRTTENTDVWRAMTMNTMRKPLLMILLLALMATGLTVARAESFQAVVAVNSMKVYAQKVPHTCLGELPRGTEVTVKGYSGEIALISYGGKSGLAQVSDMTVAAQSAEPTVSQTRTMIATRETRLYKKAKKTSKYSTIAAGASVEVLSVNGKCAKVSYNGKVGYTLYSHLGEPGSAVETTETVVDTTPVQTGNAPVAAAQSSRVYADASLSGDSIGVSKGTRMTLLAIRGDTAMVEKSGAIGYMPVSHLVSASAQKASSGKGNPFAAGSNEHAIYAFLTGEMGYNRAATMGVIANMKYESGYRTECVGDGGTSYGICQWHAGRKSNLMNFCTDNGLDYTTLEAQLQFFKYEITSRYTSVHAYLKSVENSADGAYDAGYYFCFNYEAPAARTSQSTKRGNYAKDTLWPMK